MNESKLQKLFAAARAEIPAAPAEDFERLVLRAVRREPAPRPASVFDQLNFLFPRLALAAVALMALCLAGDWLAGNWQLNLSDGIAQLSQQWLWTGNGL